MRLTRPVAALLMVVSATGEELRSLVESEWGTDLNHPSWSADGDRIYYHVTARPPREGYCVQTSADIWVVAASGEAPPVPWTEDGVNYLPAVSPRNGSGP